MFRQETVDLSSVARPVRAHRFHVSPISAFTTMIGFLFFQTHFKIGGHDKIGLGFPSCRNLGQACDDKACDGFVGGGNRAEAEIVRSCRLIFSQIESVRISFKFCEAVNFTISASWYNFYAKEISPQGFLRPISQHQFLSNNSSVSQQFHERSLASVHAHWSFSEKFEPSSRVSHPTLLQIQQPTSCFQI